MTTTTTTQWNDKKARAEIVTRTSDGREVVTDLPHVYDRHGKPCTLHRMAIVLHDHADKVAELGLVDLGS